MAYLLMKNSTKTSHKKFLDNLFKEIYRGAEFIHIIYNTIYVFES